jgi:hypothetical protein
VNVTTMCFRGAGIWMRAAVGALVLPVLLSGTALAQAPAVDPNMGALTFTATFDVPTLYMFRGLRQEVDPSFTYWPYADLRIDLGSGDGKIKGSAINFGVWNSLHTGSSGSGGEGCDLECGTHYEEDFYASWTLSFGGAVGVTTQYTAYTSPNARFTTVKEISVKVAQSSSGGGLRSLSSYGPYALIAWELDTEPGRGQADGGDEAGTYLEIGGGPSFPLGGRATLTVPVKLAFSLGDYYELGGDDHPFGFFDIGGVITVPLSALASRYGTWNLHFSGEYYHLGETGHSFNVDTDGNTSPSKFVGLIGIGMTY